MKKLSSQGLIENVREDLKNATFDSFVVIVDGSPILPFADGISKVCET